MATLAVMDKLLRKGRDDETDSNKGSDGNSSGGTEYERPKCIKYDIE
jgi:hypothetical protein